MSITNIEPTNTFKTTEILDETIRKENDDKTLSIINKIHNNLDRVNSQITSKTPSYKPTFLKSNTKNLMYNKFNHARQKEESFNFNNLTMKKSNLSFVNNETVNSRNLSYSMTINPTIK